MSVYKYSLPVYMNGVQTTNDVDVSAYMADARTGVWELYDTDSTELVGALQIVDAGTVRVSVSPALPEGEYLLVGLA